MKDNPISLGSGYSALVLHLAVLAGLIALFLFSVAGLEARIPGTGWGLACSILGAVVWLISLGGYVVVNPNEARVVQLFGTYIGTLSDTGFFYGNPFYTKTRITLRVQTFETGMTGSEEVKDAQGKVVVAASQHRQPSKVNDLDGTPIEIAAVVAWRVVRPAESVLQVDDYDHYIHIQADAALRNLASRYSYDAPEADSHSLRGHIEEVANQLRKELQERIHIAGIEVLESRISYLAYAPEIAASMLQRQQAGAIIAARQRIVEGAVGMVEHAIDLLAKKNLLEFDPAQKATLVSNLLVVLCGHTLPQPVINAGGRH
jgi:regulator of protease activity HflC (stomatin/prohibitin superfamily)